MSRKYLKHASAGIQFGLFVLVGTLVGSYLDKEDAGIVTLIGLVSGLICGTYFLLKDFIFQGRGNGK